VVLAGAEAARDQVSGAGGRFKEKPTTRLLPQVVLTMHVRSTESSSKYPIQKTQIAPFFNRSLVIV
jgi:hypothetical protein